MQILKEEPPVIVDGAHNLDAVSKTVEEVKRLYPGRKIITVFSCMKDKDYKSIIHIIRSSSDRVIATKLPFSRSITEDEISQFKDIDFIPDIDGALKKAIEEADSKSVVLITGSLYLAGEILKKIK